jgi:hypothetical protein
MKRNAFTILLGTLIIIIGLFGEVLQESLAKLTSVTILEPKVPLRFALIIAGVCLLVPEVFIPISSLLGSIKRGYIETLENIKNLKREMEIMSYLKEAKAANIKAVLRLKKELEEETIRDEE